MHHLPVLTSSVATLATLASLAAEATASVIHVPADQPTLKAAIAAAGNGDAIVVADGTYSGADNRGLNFGGKDLYLHSASGPDACIIDCSLLDRAFLFQSGEGRAAIVEGFTIRNGKPTPGAVNGGAILINGIDRTTSPTVRNCVFSANAAPNGGAVAVTGASSPWIADSVFVANTALPGGGNGFGGAMSLSGANVTATITGCTFDSNTSGGGGAIHRASSSVPTIEGCTFIKNSSTGNGGAISLTGSSTATVSNCAFFGNTASGTGGGAVLNSGSGSDSSLVNCLFSGNAADVAGLGGGVMVSAGSMTILNCTMAGNVAGSVNLGGAVAKLNGASCSIRNSVLWANAGVQINSIGAPAISVEHSIVQGGFVGACNLATDPLLVDIDGADGVVGTPDDDLRVNDLSAAIDSGSNTAWDVPRSVDFAGLPRFHDDPAVPDSGEGAAPIIDRGAHEMQPDPPTCLVADLDCDGDIDATDLGLLLGAWGSDDMDLDGDGIVGAGDLAILLGAWTG